MRYTPQDIIMHPLHAVPSCMSQDGMTQGGMTQGGMWARWAARWLGASRPTACLYILHHHLHATPPHTTTACLYMLHHHSRTMCACYRTILDHRVLHRSPSCCVWRLCVHAARSDKKTCSPSIKRSTHPTPPLPYVLACIETNV